MQLCGYGILSLWNCFVEIFKFGLLSGHHYLCVIRAAAVKGG